MSYTCPVCAMVLVFGSCIHSNIGKYHVYVYSTGEVNVWDDGDVRNGKVLTLDKPRRLDEEYIDMLVMLK
jgi:hypothetical protein